MTHLGVWVTWVESTRAWKGILQSMPKLMLNINTFIQNNFFSIKFRPFKYVLKEPDFSFNNDPWKWWVAHNNNSNQFIWLPEQILILYDFCFIMIFRSIYARLKYSKLLHENIQFYTKAAVCRCSSKWMFLKISQYSQESTSGRVSL